MFRQADSRYVPRMKKFYFLWVCLVVCTAAWSQPQDSRRSEVPTTVNAAPRPMTLRDTLQSTRATGGEAQSPGTKELTPNRRLTEQERADLRLQLQRREGRQTSP